MIRYTFFLLFFCSLTLSTWAQKGCMRQMFTELKPLRAFVFMPADKKAQMLADTSDRVQLQFYEGAEAAWGSYLLSQHVADVVAIRPKAIPEDACAMRQSRGVARLGLLILIPRTLLSQAQALGYELLPESGASAGVLNWKGLVSDLASTLGNSLNVKVDLAAIRGAAWYDTPMPSDFQPGEQNSESFLHKGVEYSRIKL
ncbi:MAG: hypothetical protein EAZ89_01000 [Bacteroidetes bacterium]|nr:MAG: hypothetical protein EAZ89_01000 [Bacteroidota bacterium]